MKEQDWLSLKSGTDIRFNAVATEQETKNIDAAMIRAIAAAFAHWLANKRGVSAPRIAVGRDCRISGEEIVADVTAALTQSGCEVLDCGMCSTPSMFFMTQYPSVMADGSIMVTASHHPFHKNGLKFFTPNGGLEGADISAILKSAAEGVTLSAATVGNIKRHDFMKLYAHMLMKKFRDATGEERPLDGLKIVVDAGNGAGGFFVSRVLEPLGADTTGSQFLEPDGMFPNHVPNPENATAMKSISDCVLRAKADLGIIFDTDVDRAAIVAPDGKEINRNKLIALIGSIVIQETPGATIVTDSVTSDGLHEFIASMGGKHHRFKRGYKNVIDEAVRLTKTGVNAPLAIETSGHAALAENFYLDDGAYLVIKILIELCRANKRGIQLTDAIRTLKEPCESAEVRLGYRCEDWKQAGARALDALQAHAANVTGWRVADDSHEGVRVSTEDGFFLVRMSVHDPNMPVNIESNHADGVKRMANALYEILNDNADLDLDKLKAIC